MKSVDNGVALLDERLPGWREHVDVDDLDLERCEDCVLGQLFGDYAKGVEVLGLGSPARFGFISPRGSYERLTAAWRRVLAA